MLRVWKHPLPPGMHFDWGTPCPRAVSTVTSNPDDTCPPPAFPSRRRQGDHQGVPPSPASPAVAYAAVPCGAWATRQATSPPACSHRDDLRDAGVGDVSARPQTQPGTGLGQAGAGDGGWGVGLYLLPMASFGRSAVGLGTFSSREGSAAGSLGRQRGAASGWDGVGDMREVIDWVSLTERNEGRGWSGRAAHDDFYTLTKIEDKTLTVPVGNRSYPHSGHISEGVVTVKATSHSSIIIPQRPWRPPTTSEKSKQAVFGRASAHAPPHPRTAVGTECPTDCIKLKPPAAMKVSGKRDRRIVSRLVSGQIDTVEKLPMPALFEMAQ